MGEAGCRADGAQVLGSNLADLGWGRTVPYLAMFLASNGGGWLGDYLIQSCRFSVASARKTVNSIGTAPFPSALLELPMIWHLWQTWASWSL